MQLNVAGYVPANTQQNQTLNQQNGPSNPLGTQEVVAKLGNNPTTTQTGNKPLSGGAERDAAFRAARNRGDREFEFGGKRFTTQLAGENEEDWNAYLQSKKTPVTPISSNSVVTTPVQKVEPVTLINRTKVSTTQPKPGITDQNTDAYANQARYE